MRPIRIFAFLCAAIGVLLLLSDFIVRDQALALAAFSMLTGSAVFGILLLRPIHAPGDDVWTEIAWGRFFVAIIYTSMAIVFLLAMTHTPDAARFVHAVRAAL